MSMRKHLFPILSLLKLCLVVCMLGVTTIANADNFAHSASVNDSALASFKLKLPSVNRWEWQKLREDVNPYTFRQDMTWVGVPLFAAGIIAKSEKKSFRQDYNNIHSNIRLVTNFKTEIDNYTQYFGPAMAIGLKLGGVEGRSDWGRFLASSAMSYAAMAVLVNSIKYTSREMRPDGSTRNSWPSGHTATSFVGATILHKEYGLTHSPWYSVAGYSVATATGIMRVLNNRHWVSDVLSGAGIGIISGELGYALCDLIFKNQGLRRQDRDEIFDSNHPSFFSVSMGLGLDNPTLNIDVLDMFGDFKDHYDLSFQASTAVAVEGAYFMNKYVGLGGRMRVKSTPIKGWNNMLNAAYIYLDILAKDIRDENEISFDQFISSAQFNIESDHLTEFAADMGLYFNIPLSRRFSLGTKALVGHSVMQELDLDAHFTGHVYEFKYDAVILNGELQLDKLNAHGYTDTGKLYDCQWDYATLSASNSTKWGTGVSLTYAYKHNFMWKVFADFDYTKKDFTLTIDPDRFMADAVPSLLSFYQLFDGLSVIDPDKGTTTKKLYQWTLGASFSVAF